MKIVIIAPEVFPVPPVRGGAVETIIEEVSTCLKDHQVHVLSISDPALALHETKNHRAYHRFKQNLFDRLLLSSWKLPFKQSRSFLYYWPYSHWAGKKIREIRPDVIWLHTRIQFVPALKKAAPNAKLILSLHNESNLKDSEVWTPQAVESCDLITFCSQSLADAAAEKYPALKKHGRVLYNGVDLKAFLSLWENTAAREELRRKHELQNSTVILYAGRLVEEKGVHVLIEAFKGLAQENKAGSGKRTLLVAGAYTFSDGRSTPYIDSLKKAAEGYDVRFLGHIPRTEISKYFLMSDMLAFPSLWKEPFGMTAVEAMASGLPVVAFNQGGPVEMITPESDGILIPIEEKVLGLSRALERLCTNPALRERLGRRARKTAEERFSWQKIAEDFLFLSQTTPSLRGAVGDKSISSDRNDGRIRVLIAESGSGYGGTAKYLAHLLRHLDRKKFRIEVVSYGDGPFMKEIEKSGESVSYHKNWKFESGRPDFWTLPARVFSIASWLKKNRVQVVHLNNEILTHIPLLVASKLAGSRVVCHLHGWRPFTRLEKFFLSFVDEFISISHAGALYFEGLIRRKVHPVPNGLSINGELEGLEQKRARFRARFGIEENEILGVLPGRLVEWKGQEIYLQALAKIAKTYPRIRGAVMGYDPSEDQEYLMRLKRLAAELGVETKVRFLPFQDDIWEVYAGADMVIHASTKPEPFGLVILEAMFAAKPVIATRAGGVTDLVTDEETGILVEPGNIQGMADAIARLSSEPELARRLGAAGAERARNVFTMEKNAAKVAEIYERLAQKS